MTEQTRKELEEQATKLYGNLVYPKTHIELYVEGYIAGAEGYEKQKEINKELVDDIAALQRDKADLIFVRDQKAKHINELKDQLTKAKEIIRQFLNDYPVITKELLDKLEQFIKELEK